MRFNGLTVHMTGSVRASLLCLLALAQAGCPASGEFVGRPAAVLGNTTPGPPGIVTFGGGIVRAEHEYDDGTQVYTWDYPRFGPSWALIMSLPVAHESIDITASLNLPHQLSVRYQFLGGPFDASVDVGAAHAASFAEGEDKSYIGINLSPHVSSITPYVTWRLCRGTIYATYGVDETTLFNGEHFRFEQMEIHVGVAFFSKGGGPGAWTVEVSYCWPSSVFEGYSEIDNHTWGIWLVRTVE